MSINGAAGIRDVGSFVMRLELFVLPKLTVTKRTMQAALCSVGMGRL
jgi:hypothetical protein